MSVKSGDAYRRQCLRHVHDGGGMWVEGEGGRSGDETKEAQGEDGGVWTVKVDEEQEIYGLSPKTTSVAYTRRRRDGDGKEEAKGGGGSGRRAVYMTFKAKKTEEKKGKGGGEKMM